MIYLLAKIIDEDPLAYQFCRIIVAILVCGLLYMAYNLGNDDDDNGSFQG